MLGLPFDTPPPYAPVDEEYPGRPETAYSLSKLMGEEMAKQFCRWDPELKIIGLRFSNVMEPARLCSGFRPSTPTRAQGSGTSGAISTRATPRRRSARRSKRRLKGAEIFIIANADTVMSRPNAELMAEVYPDVPLKEGFGRQRNAAVDRQGAAAARLRAAAQLARQLRASAIVLHQMSSARGRMTRSRMVTLAGRVSMNTAASATSSKAPGRDCDPRTSATGRARGKNPDEVVVLDDKMVDRRDLTHTPK